MDRKLFLYLGIGFLVLFAVAGIYLFKRYQVLSVTQSQTAKINRERGEAIAKQIATLRQLASDTKTPHLKPNYQKTIEARQKELRKLGLEGEFPEAMQAP